MANISVDAEFNDSEVRSFLNNVLKKSKNISQFKNEYVGLLSSIIYKDIISHFEDESGSQGPWKSWSKSYRDSMEKRGRGGNKILQDNGTLRNAFTPQKFRKTSEGILWFNNAKTKSGFPYAAAHNSGGKRLPKRDFMWTSKGALEEISAQTLQYMIEKGV